MLYYLVFCFCVFADACGARIVGAVLCKFLRILYFFLRDHDATVMYECEGVLQ